MILNALFFNYDLEKAVIDPRLHNQLSPNATVAEHDFDKVSVTISKQYWYMWLIAGWRGMEGGNPSTESPPSPNTSVITSTRGTARYIYLHGCGARRQIFQHLHSNTLIWGLGHIIFWVYICRYTLSTLYYLDKQVFLSIHIRSLLCTESACLYLCSCRQNILDGLALKNHEIDVLKSMGAVVQAVLRQDEGLQAKSDPRKWAYAAGYWGHKHISDYARRLQLREPWHQWHQLRD